MVRASARAAPSLVLALALVLACLCLCLSLCASVCEAAPLSAGASKKLSRVARLSRGRGNRRGTVALGDRNFTRYTAEGEVPYHSFVLFTADDPKYQCSVCAQSTDTLEGVARLYRRLYNVNTTEHPIAFFIVDVDSAPQTFGRMQIQTAPHLYHVKPRTKAIAEREKTRGADGKLINSEELDASVWMHGPGALGEAIKLLTGVAIEEPPKPDAALVFGTVGAILFALVATQTVRGWEAAKQLVRRRLLWFTVSLLVYGFGIGGMVFCIIRTPPLYPGQYTREGANVPIFSTANREQYILEGVLVAGMHLASGLALVVAYQCSRSKFFLVRYFGGIMALSCFIVVFSNTYTAYQLKQGWYRLSEVLSWRGMYDMLTQKLKKKSGLLHRLYRLGYYFLFQFKSVDALYQRFDTHIVKYVVAKLGLA